MFFLFPSVIIVFVYVGLVVRLVVVAASVSRGLMDKWMGNKYIVVRSHLA